MRLHKWVCGQQPPGVTIDHINGDRLDNRRANLRIANQHINLVNTHRLNRNNTSGVRGVWFARGQLNPWIAEIKVYRHKISLGRYSTKAEAMTARHAGELKYFGVLCPTLPADSHAGSI